MKVNSELFKQAMSQFPSGVTVITTRYEGKVHGMTASAFISVSLEPPLVLESIDKNTQTHHNLMQTDIYGVSILEASQSDVSNHFAGFDPQDLEPSFTELNNFPVIKGTIAQMICKVVARYEAGDHTLFIGQVEHISLGKGEPLLYYNRSYGKFRAL